MELDMSTTTQKFEVTTIPVADVDRAKAFYLSLGWRLDIDFEPAPGVRGVQITPPGSPTSIQFGENTNSMQPGSLEGLFLVVDDIDAARAELVAKGADVSEPFHFAGIRGARLPGPDPERRTYATYAAFKDPDGNSWLLQEVKARLPGRGLSNDVATLTDLLAETEKRHGEYEPSGPKHHWSAWYAAYVIARQRGRTSDEAARDAALRIEDVLSLAKT
jgi:catechol 2,3-dioxygenase-like lactoylglutathione lyase family enzyme